MYVILDKTMPNGATGRVHVLDELALTSDKAVATITSRVAIEGRTCWQERVEVPADNLDTHTYESAVTSLTGPGGYLEGGVLMSDPTPVEAIKASKLSAVDRARDDALAGGCTTPLGPVDTDMVSRQNISGAVSMALLAKTSGASFSMKWRMRDNSYVDLTADAMIVIGMIVGQFVSNTYGRSWELKARIAEASSPEAVEDIPITFGEPEPEVLSEPLQEAPETLTQTPMDDQGSADTQED